MSDDKSNPFDDDIVEQTFAPVEKIEEVVEDLKKDEPETPEEMQSRMDAIAERAEKLANDPHESGRVVINEDSADTYFNSRFIESTDDHTKPKTFNEDHKYVEENLQVRASGVVFDGVLDTGDGAQEVEPVGLAINEDRDDPKSLGYAVCVNKNCPIRATCMRYRKSLQRDNKIIFFPEQCKEDGIYQPISEDMGGLDSMEVLEPTSTPSL